MSVNKVIIVGRLGQDPEIRNTSSGTAVANFSVATSESWTDKTGQKQERTEWHRIVVWSRLAELCQQYLSKGRQVYVEGRLQTRQWQDNTGATRYTTEIQAQTIQFLGGSAGASTGAGAQSFDRQESPSFGAGASSEPSGMGMMSGGGQNEEPSFTEDDIPF